MVNAILCAQGGGRGPNAMGGLGTPGMGSAGGSGGNRPAFPAEWRYLFNLVGAFRYSVFSPRFRASLDQVVYTCELADAGVLPRHLEPEVEDSLKLFSATLQEEGSSLNPLDRRYLSSAFLLLGVVLTMAQSTSDQARKLARVTADYLEVINRDYDQTPGEFGRYPLFEEERNLVHLFMGLEPHILPSEFPMMVRQPLAAAIGRVGLASAALFWPRWNIELLGLEAASWCVFPDLPPETLSRQNHGLRIPHCYFRTLLNWRLGDEVEVDYLVSACMQMIGAMASVEPHTWSRPNRYHYRCYLADYDLIRPYVEGGGGVTLDPELDYYLRTGCKNVLVSGVDHRSWRRLMAELVDWAEENVVFHPLSRQDPGLTPFLRQALGAGFMS